MGLFNNDDEYRDEHGNLPEQGRFLLNGYISGFLIAVAVVVIIIIILGVVFGGPRS